MSLPQIDLFDKNFEELVDEGKKLIPVHAPQWTDYHLSDPGITFIELLAWITEGDIYRLNLITDAHKIKYLTLLGARPHPQKQARVDLTFSSDKEITLSKGTLVSTDQMDERIEFELVDDVVVVPATLDKVIVDELVKVIDRSIFNTSENLNYAPFGINAQEGSTLYLGFSSKSPIDTVSLMCYLYERDLIPKGVHGEEDEYDYKNAQLRWEYSILGDDNTVSWQPVSLSIDETSDFKKSGRLVFKNMQNWISFSDITIWKDSNEKKYYWLRSVLEESDYEYAPRLDSILLNSVSALHGNTIKYDIEERVSNGFPDQTFRLLYNNILYKTLKLRLKFYAGSKEIYEEWIEKDDFDSSTSYDNHFIVDRKNGVIKFGDGLMGRVPPGGAFIEVVEYKIGGGTIGNVHPSDLWMIDNNKSVKARNYFSGRDGLDSETTLDATVRFIKDLRVPYTTVTSKDIEYLAKNTPGLRVANVCAIPNYHPKKGSLYGSVTIVVIPFTPFEPLTIPPEPSVGFKKAVCNHVDNHRLICMDIHVVSPEYIKVNVYAVVLQFENYKEEDIRTGIIDRLNKFIHPIKGGPDGTGWPIGRDVYMSEIYNVIEDVEGVDAVTELVITGEKGAYHDNEGNLILPSKTSTVYPGEFIIDFIKRSDTCRK